MATKTRARRDQLVVGAGHDGAWVQCTYVRWLNHMDREGKWHSCQWEFQTRGGIYERPNVSMWSRLHREDWPWLMATRMLLMRPAPLRMNELREIDIMEGWAEVQSLPAKVTDEDT